MLRNMHLLARQSSCVAFRTRSKEYFLVCPSFEVGVDHLLTAFALLHLNFLFSVAVDRIPTRQYSSISPIEATVNVHLQVVLIRSLMFPLRTLVSYLMALSVVL